MSLTKVSFIKNIQPERIPLSTWIFRLRPKWTFGSRNIYWYRVFSSTLKIKNFSIDKCNILRLNESHELLPIVPIQYHRGGVFSVLDRCTMLPHHGRFQSQWIFLFESFTERKILIIPSIDEIKPREVAI
jgi:hypothetical protein